jgi:hypothetical protein
MRAGDCTERVAPSLTMRVEVFYSAAAERA